PDQAMPLVLPQSYSAGSVIQIPAEPQTVGDHIRKEEAWTQATPERCGGSTRRRQDQCLQMGGKLVHPGHPVHARRSPVLGGQSGRGGEGVGGAAGATTNQPRTATEGSGEAAKRRSDHFGEVGTW